MIHITVLVLLLMGIHLSPVDTHSSKAAGASIHLAWLSRYQGTGAEISAYDPATRRLFVTGAGSQVAVLDLSDPAAPVQAATVPLGATSVAVNNGVLALAVPDPSDKTNPGHVYLYPADTFANPIKIEVGALPDMLTFTPNGRRILVANEGEPTALVDPEGSVSMIDIGRGIHQATVKTARFKRFNDQRAALVAQGVASSQMLKTWLRIWSQSTLL